MREHVAEAWRTSLQVRFVGTVLIVSTAVMLVLGFALASVVAQRVTTAKVGLATTEIERARVVAEEQIDGSGSTGSTQTRFNSARAVLGQRSQQDSEAAAVYEPVLLLENADGSLTTSPEGYEVPERLRQFVSEGNVAYQFHEALRSDGSSYKALIVGLSLIHISEPTKRS